MIPGIRSIGLRPSHPVPRARLVSTAYATLAALAAFASRSAIALVALAAVSAVLPESAAFAQSPGQDACRQTRNKVYDVMVAWRSFCGDPAAQDVHWRMYGLLGALGTSMSGGTFLPGFGYYAAVYNSSCETSKAIAATMEMFEANCDADLAVKNARQASAHACAEMNRVKPGGPLPAWCPRHAGGYRYCGAIQYTGGVGCFTFHGGGRQALGTLKEFHAAPSSDMILGGSSIGSWRRTSVGGQACYVPAGQVVCSDQY